MTDLLSARLHEEANQETFEAVILAELECRFGDRGRREGAVGKLEQLTEGESPYVSQRATLELARFAVETSGDLTRARKLMQELGEDRVLESLRYARWAQLSILCGEADVAAQYGREAFNLVGWWDEPVHQLEVLLTSACTTSPLQAEAARRVHRLTEFGWRLLGRSFDRSLGSCGDAGPLLRAVTASPAMVKASGGGEPMQAEPFSAS